MQKISPAAMNLHKVSLVILSIAALIFPLCFTSLTTDAFALPKELLIALAAGVSILLYAVYMVIERKMVFRFTPFDLPILAFLLVTLFSALFAVNSYDSLTAFFPILFAVALFYAITNIVKSESEVVFFVTAAIIGSLVSGLLSLLSFFQIYLLPFAASHNQGFTTFGSLLDQAIYLAIILPLSGYLALPLLQKGNKQVQSISDNSLLIDSKSKTKQQTKGIVFAGITLLLLASFLVTMYQLFTIQKPLLLPFSVGFQTGLASISQDANLLKSFLLGSGVGTYMTDFTRFKPLSFNVNPTLWSFTFFRSSSYFLEIVATTGFLGSLAFLFLVYQVIRQKTLFLPVVIALLAAFLLPFSPVIATAFFMILAIFACLLAWHYPQRFPTAEFHFVALNEGLLAAHTQTNRKSTQSRVLPIVTLALVLVITGVVGYFTYIYTLSDVIFNQSLLAASRNDGQSTYNLQRQAIGTYPWRDTYYRNFSQTNLALANALAASQPKNSKPDTTVQNTVLQLIQQSITAGRQAVTISPATALNWNNLSSIYRSLIGFGQNADSFSVLTSQQAIALDANNPQQYINLGGIYYQLGKWDNAIEQFTNAYKAKPDYANAYYNLGHAYESKGDQANLQNALAAYRIVAQLVANDKNSSKKIADEIKALQDKISNQATTTNGTTPTASTQANGTNPNSSLNVSNPPAQLPARNPKVNIPGPTISITPTTQPSPSVAPTSAATSTPAPTTNP